MAMTSPEEAPLPDDAIMEITITVLSLNGVVAKKYESKMNSPLRKSSRLAANTDATTSIVASFSQSLSSRGGSGTLFMTHVPSNPIKLETIGSKPVVQPTIHWPRSMNKAGPGGDSDEKIGEALSTIQFSRRFQREAVDKNTTTSTLGRFIPQTFPINISISRRGKLIVLGKADIYISGDEKGESSTILPISSTLKKSVISSPLRKSSSSVTNVTSIPMMRMKGDDLQFGLKAGSVLRVLVSVSETKVDDNGVATAQVNGVSNKQIDSISDATDEEECEIANVTFEHEEDGFESFLQFLGGSKDADDIRKQSTNSVSPLSKDGGDDFAGEERVADAPKLPFGNDDENEDTNDDTLVEKMAAKVLEERSEAEISDAVSASMESRLMKVCETLHFDIAEMWLRIGPTKHKLICYHVSNALDGAVKKETIDVYRGEDALKIKHRLSSAMLKWAKENQEMLKLTTQTSSGKQALHNSLISGIKLAVAVPVSHDGINVTIVYGSLLNGANNIQSKAEQYLIQKSTEIVKMTYEMVKVANYSPKNISRRTTMEYARSCFA